MTDCVDGIRPIFQPSTVQVLISLLFMGALFRLCLGGEKPNRIRLGAPAFPGARGVLGVCGVIHG